AKLQLNEGGDRAFYTAQTLARIFDLSLRLLHPFTPFVTEELWESLKNALQERPDLHTPAEGWAEALMVARYPIPKVGEAWEEKIIADFSAVQEAVRAIRNLRAEKKVTPGKRIPAILAAGDKLGVFQGQVSTLTALAFLDTAALILAETLQEKPQGSVGLVVAGIEIYLPLAGLVDVEFERARLQKELAEMQTQIERLENLLKSDFARRAPPPLVEKERQKLIDFQETAGKLKEQLKNI
ncbi:MAG: class I tRNA ligase family protein, partial [Acidobacteriia bacterium]|nr:class I tRNA ligase family protein [Terriglobia bacterium]